MTSAANPHLRPPDLTATQQAALRQRLSGALSSDAVDAVPRSESAGPQPLSFGQQRLWFLDQLIENSPLYNMGAAVRLRGFLDLGALQHAVDAVVDRHEVLRMTVIEIDGRPAAGSHATRVALQVAPLPVSQEVADAVTMIAQKPFNLSTGPLLRVSVLACGPAENVVVVVLHHIVADRWSLNVLFEELAAAYGQACAERVGDLPSLACQYMDYAAWQRSRLRGVLLDRLLAYWRVRLAGAPPALALPTDRPRPVAPTYRGGVVFRPLPGSTIKKASQLARAEGVTVYMVLLAAWAALLRRYSGQDDLIVGVPVSGRDRVEFEKLIGLFINLLPVRVEISDGSSFRTLLRSIRSTLLEAYAHAELPYERLVDALRPNRSASHAPVFQVMFDVWESARSGHAFAGLEVEPLPVETATSKYDLSLTVEQHPDGWRTKTTFSSDLFDPATVERLVHHFEMVLHGAVDAPDQQVGTIALLTATERAVALSQWNGTATTLPVDRPVHELIEEQTRRTPEAIAVCYGAERLTYAELQSRAERLADRLREQGVGPEVPVGVCLTRSVELVVGLLGVLRAGGAYVPLDPAHPRRRLAIVIKDAAVPVVVTQQRLASRFQTTATRLVVLESDAGRTGTALTASPHQPTADNLAYVIYTSGSTGVPKGVQISHRNLTNVLLAMANGIGLQGSDVLLSVTTPAFDIAALELFIPLVRGARVVVAPEGAAADATQLKDQLADHCVTMLQATPATWRELTDVPTTSPSIRLALCGGEAMYPALARSLRSVAQRAWNVYGPTETTIWSTVMALDDDDLDPVPIGRPIANTRIYVVDDRLEPVPVGIAGELCIAGDGVSRGYRNRPGLTAERFVPDPFDDTGGGRLYRTGDLARRRPDGTVEFLGRIDNQVKIRGLRIELGDVEAALRAHPGVQDAVVVSHAAGRDARLIAYLVPTDPSWCPSSDELRAATKAILPEYMVPTAYVVLDALPLTPNGKVNRRALSAHAPYRADSRETFLAPRTELERVLAATMQQVLSEVVSVDRVGVFDDFFDLGGHSLLAARAVALIRAALHVDLPVRVLMEHRTVAGLAAVINQARADRSPSSSAAPRVGIRPGRRSVVLVTGGTGVVGSFIVAELVQRGVDVRVLARAGSQQRAQAMGAEAVPGDLTDPASLTAVVRGVDCIIHAACTFTQPEADVTAMAALLQGWNRGSFVYISSTDVYGRPASLPAREGDDLDEGYSPYAAGKVRCEQMLREAAQAGQGCGYSILRPPYVWGPHPYCLWQIRMTVAKPIYAAARGRRPLVIPGLTPQARAEFGHAWVDARELAWAAVECLANPVDGAANIVTGHFTWHDLSMVLIRLTGLSVPVEYGEVMSGPYARRCRYSGDLLQRRLGFAPSHRWEEVLAEVVREAERAAGGVGRNQRGK